MNVYARPRCEWANWRVGSDSGTFHKGATLAENRLATFVAARRRLRLVVHLDTRAP